MIKQVFVGAAVVIGLTATGALAQQGGAQPRARTTPAGSGQGEGHTTPKQQPTTAPEATVPTGELALGTVSLRKAVKADGKALPAGTYQVRLTAQAATGDAKGA